MDLTWDLSALYESFDSDGFKSDYEKLPELIGEFNEWSKNNLCSHDNAKEKIEQYLSLLEGTVSKFYLLVSYSELVLSANAKDERALRISGKLEEIWTDTTASNVMFVQWLKNVDTDSLEKESEVIKKYSFFIKQLKLESKYTLSEAEEVIIAKMKNTGSSAWVKLQSHITSTLLVDINIDGEDKKLPLPAVRNLAYDNNAALRKNAYEQELLAYEKIVDSSTYALNSYKGEVITECKLRGYNSPLERTLINSRIDKDILDAMLTAMRESLPIFAKYFRKKAQLLGTDGPLPFYDLFAPVGEIDMRFTYEQAWKYVVDNFSKFSKNLGDYADNAFRNRWIDVEPRECKTGGAFCANLHPIKQSRILTNFTGSFSDMTTLAHELGHGYHGHMLNDEAILNSDYPMPIAETASTFCETLVINAAIKTATDEEKTVILENSISGCAQVIVDILSRYIFETKVFESRVNGVISTNELCDFMLEAQKEAYTDGLDHNFLHKYMWVCKSHYYGSNFYNFPYAYGQLFANGLYARYLEQGEKFVDQYDKMLSVTGKMNLADVAKMVGVDVYSVDFWRSSIKMIEKDIDIFVQL